MKQHKKLLALLAFTICLAFGAAALYTPNVYAAPTGPETRDETEAPKESSTPAAASSSAPVQPPEPASTQAPKPEPEPEPDPPAQTQAPPKENTQTQTPTPVQTNSSRAGSVQSRTQQAGSTGTSSFESSEASSELSSLQSEASSEVSSGIRLPSVAEVSGAEVLSAPVSDDGNHQINWLGIISWVCIGIGILIVVIVILSNRRPPRSGYGRTRYKHPKSRRRGRKAHLLNDKYYRRL